MKKKRRLTDPCSLCGEPVWQYGEDGKAYCEAHARWKHIEIERVNHPLDAHHATSVLPHRVERATKVIVSTIRRMGYAEAFWVAEHLAFENGVQWWDERVVIRLSDLQLVAFAAAMRTHCEALYPKQSWQSKVEASNARSEEAERREVRKKKKRTL